MSLVRWCTVERVEDNVVRLRPYQRKAIAKWLECRRGTIELPTGTGKTYIGIWVIYEYLREGKRIAVIVPTQYLAHQWRRKLGEYGINCVSLYYANEKGLDRVTIFVYNSAIMRKDLVLRHDLVIIDEIHHFGADGGLELLELIRENGRDIMGLTATLERSDGRHYYISSVAHTVYRMHVSQAINQGYVVRARVIPIGVELDFDERKLYKYYEEKIKLLKSYVEEDRDEGVKRRLMILYNKRKQLTSRARAKMDIVLEICRRFSGERILLFSESIESVERLKSFLSRYGVRCMTIHSRLSMKKRLLILKNWGRSFNVLLAVRSLDEGIDIPECGVGIILSSGLTTRQLVQRVGRLIRPAKGKDLARIFVVYAKRTFEEKVVYKICRIVGQKPYYSVDWKGIIN